MYDQDSVFTGRFHHVAKSDLSPNGRLLSIWKNAEGGTFYRDICELTILSENRRQNGQPEEAKIFLDIITKMNAERARLDAPRFPF